MNSYRNPKNGDEISTTLTPDQAAELCSEKGNNFAQDLASKYDRSRYLGNNFSEAQLFWLMKLGTEIHSPPDVPMVKIDDAYNKVVETFSATGLRRPKLRFVTEVGTVAISLTRAGRVHVTCGDAYQGEIKDDAFYYRKTCHEVVKKLLPILFTDLKSSAVLWGRKTGCCCFCAQELTTPESVTAGYGPICAERWGLPWGHVSQADTEITDADIPSVS